MKFKAHVRPEECASKDFSRPHLNAVYFDKDAARLVATDGHCIISIPVEVEAGDVTGLVPCAAIKAARKRRQKGEGRLRLGKKLTDDGHQLHRRGEGRFPTYEQAIPAWKRGDEGTVTFGVNPLLLIALARAAGNESRAPILAITLKITPEMLEPILVGCDGVDGAVAVCMPGRP